MNCTNPPSNLTNQFTYGVTVTQTFLGALQVVLSFVPFITDYIFYMRSYSPEVIQKQEELKKVLKEHESLLNNDPTIILETLEDLKAYIKHSQSSSSDSARLVKKTKLIACLKKIQARMLEISAPDPEIFEPETSETPPENMIGPEMPSLEMAMPNEFELNPIGVIQ